MEGTQGALEQQVGALEGPQWWAGKAGGQQVCGEHWVPQHCWSRADHLSWWPGPGLPLTGAVPAWVAW